MSASLPPIRSRRSRVAPSTAGPARRHAPGDRRGAILRRMLEIQCGMPEIYRRVRLRALLLARVFIN
jgi:hypothetical protein